MDINIQWVSPFGTLPTDYFNVLYKEYDLYPPINGLNDWILATDPPLPSTQLSYTITGLKENTIYRIMVTKACVGTTEIVDEITFIRTGYPIVATWQGPVVNSYPTLFYSVYYPDGPHIKNANVFLSDTQTYDATKCGLLVIGRNGYLTGSYCCPTPPGIPCLSSNQFCNLQNLDYKLPSNISSAVSYYGRDSLSPLFPTCDGTASQPILLKYNNDYKLYSESIPRFSVDIRLDDPAVQPTPASNWPAFNFPSDPTQPYPNLNTANISNISSAICFDPSTAIVDYTFADGTGRTNINDYLFSFVTSDGVNSIPLVDNSGNLITSHNGSYNIYAPIKIETYAPGGGNPLGYTITNASVSGTDVTYTYTGGTNAFTVGQEVFVNSINPVAFQFATTSKTITAATSNSFTVTISPAPVDTYQTGGIASGYTEITNDMTITVDLQPTQNVITLTNQNYAGLTLKQALDQIAGAINAGGIYTASAVIIGGYPYLKINTPNSTYIGASVIFEGPNILTKGGPDYPQISQNGSSAYATSSSFYYNGFLYASYYTSSTATAEIIATDTSLAVSPVSYGHDIDIPVWTMALVEETPPTTVYSLDHVTSGGDYSLNITVAETGGWNQGYVYTADNTTINVYDPITSTIIDSKDITTLPGVSNNPIRLMEYNNTDNRLYAFVDGVSNNFYIFIHGAVGVWATFYTGTYGQTNYLKRGTITAANNLTTGPTAAMGFITSNPPTKPIPCGTIACACVPPAVCPGVPNWVPGLNDGVRSELFQDNTKSWAVNGPYNTNFYHVYNYNTQQLGRKVNYVAGDPYHTLEGIVGDTIAISTAIDSTLTNKAITYSSFSSSFGDQYGLFQIYLIYDYTGNFTSRSWENTARYLIENGRNQGSNGFINSSFIATNYVSPDYYPRNLVVNSNRVDKQLNSLLALDGTSEYLLFEIKDGGTCYNSNSNLVYVSLDGGVVQTINNAGTVSTYNLYKDFPGTSDHVQVPLQMVADPNSLKVYAIARDARSAVDDMNIYVLDNTGQIDVIQGSTRWNMPICGQLSFNSAVGHLIFTAKNTRKIIRLEDPGFGSTFWTIKDIPSVYEKFNGYTYGDGSIIERVQGATLISGEKFVVMNYLKQTFSTELKHTYDVANLFVYDFGNNTVEQVLIGTGVSAYSGVATSYNPNYYGEGFGINDYNTDYCYGGLGIKVDSTGKIYWKKAISDQVYLSKAHTESGVAQIWGTALAGNCPASNLIRIWNIQSDGSLVQSKRTILDSYSSFSYITYDSFYQRLLTIPLTPSNVSAQFYVINTQNLTGSYGVNDNGTTGKYNVASNIGGLAVSTYLSGKQTAVYAVSINPATPGNPSTITYSVRPYNASATYNGIFPHHYAVGEVVKISGIVSSPVDELNFPNSNTSSTAYATILSITPTTFTVANTFGATATYTSGGTVVDAVWASIYTASNFGSMSIDNKGGIIVTGTGNGSGVTGYNNPGTTFILKYESDDLFTQRENPKVFATGVTSALCVATPDGLFRGLSAPAIGRVHGQLNNAFLLHAAAQNTYWVMGSKNPSCTISGVTSAVYNPITQTIRYNIPNSFTVGKVIDISGIIPSAYNLTRVAITAVDPTWIEVSYTGAAPAGYTSGGSISLSSNFVIKVLDDTTLSTIATIDLTYINSLLDIWTNPDNFTGRFQYSEDTDEIYLYSEYTSQPVYVFSTITNSLVRSSSFNRMVLPYNKLNRAFTLEDVNGIPYFSAYTPTDTPTRRWFRLDLGQRYYLNDVHNELAATATDAVTNFTYNYDFFGSYSGTAATFGQWKDIMDTTWATIPTSITTTLNSTIEFVSFKLDSPILSIENNTTGYLYTPTNTLNFVPVYSILIDNVNISNADALNITFANPDNPSCPFTRQVTIYF